MTSRHILVLLAVAAGLRIGMLLLLSPWDPEVLQNRVLVRDALGYHTLAQQFVEQRRFTGADREYLDALRTPGYPLFLAGIYLVAGERPWVVLLVQCLLDTLTCLILYLHVARLFSRRAAFISGLMYALDPILIYYCSTLLSDVLFVFIIVVLLWFCGDFSTLGIDRHWWRTALILGMLTGCAAVIRPIAQALPVAVGLGILLAARMPRPRVLVFLGVLALGHLLTLVPWGVRNSMMYGSPSISISGSFNLLWLHVLSMETNRTGSAVETTRAAFEHEVDSMITAERVGEAARNPFIRARYWSRVGLRRILDHPVAYIRAFTEGVVFMFLNLNTGAFAERIGISVRSIDTREVTGLRTLIDLFFRWRPLPVMVLGSSVALFLGVTYVCALAGIAGAWRSMDRRLILAYAAIGLFFVIITGPAGLSRFKLPIVPVYLTFAGDGALRLKQWLSRVRASRGGGFSG